jgi:hypothetical protein
MMDINWDTTITPSQHKLLGCSVDIRNNLRECFFYKQEITLTWQQNDFGAFTAHPIHAIMGHANGTFL